MVNIGIVGVGRISAKHIRGIYEAGNAAIAAICDIDTERLHTVGEQLGIPASHRFIDYNDLIACADVDAVEVCTPNHLHVPIALAAARAGKHVQVEKPLGLCAEQEGITELLRTVEEKKLVNMMDFSYRFKDAVRYAKEFLRQGKLGKLLNVNIE